MCVYEYIFTYKIRVHVKRNEHIIIITNNRFINNFAYHDCISFDPFVLFDFIYIYVLLNENDIYCVREVFMYKIFLLTIYKF